jgi:hypothetical protein
VYRIDHTAVLANLSVWVATEATCPSHSPPSSGYAPLR